MFQKSVPEKGVTVVNNFQVPYFWNQFKDILSVPALRGKNLFFLKQEGKSKTMVKFTVVVYAYSVQNGSLSKLDD